VAIRRAKLTSGEVVRLNGVHATSILRTLLDVARYQPLVEAVVAMDAALHKKVVSPGQLRAYVAAKGGHRGFARLDRVVGLAEPATESPMETRLRMVLVLAGLPRPAVQVPIHDQRGRYLGRPDLYYASSRLGLEYDGASHRGNLASDVQRQNRLLATGIRLLRFTATDVRNAPDLIVRQVRAVIADS